MKVNSLLQVHVTYKGGEEAKLYSLILFTAYYSLNDESYSHWFLSKWTHHSNCQDQEGRRHRICIHIFFSLFVFSSIAVVVVVVVVIVVAVVKKEPPFILFHLIPGNLAILSVVLQQLLPFLPPCTCFFHPNVLQLIFFVQSTFHSSVVRTCPRNQNH